MQVNSVFVCTMYIKLHLLPLLLSFSLLFMLIILVDSYLAS